MSSYRVILQSNTQPDMHIPLGYYEATGRASAEALARKKHAVMLSRLEMQAWRFEVECAEEPKPTGSLHIAPPRARVSDPSTSHAAAAGPATRSAKGYRFDVLRVLREHPDGLTSHQMSDHTGIELVCLSPLLRPMERAGVIVDTKTTRKTERWPNASLVWKIAP